VIDTLGTLTGEHAGNVSKMSALKKRILFDKWKISPGWRRVYLFSPP
jgi:hypothetical protein